MSTILFDDGNKWTYADADADRWDQTFILLPVTYSFGDRKTSHQMFLPGPLKKERWKMVFPLDDKGLYFFFIFGTHL